MKSSIQLIRKTHMERLDDIKDLLDIKDSNITFEEKYFFELISDTINRVHPIFKTVFLTFLKDKEKIINALKLPYSNAKLEATNNLIKVIKRNAFGFRNFENFKKRIYLALNTTKRENQSDSLSVLAISQPTSVDKEPKCIECAQFYAFYNILHYLSSSSTHYSSLNKLSLILKTLSKKTEMLRW